MPDQNGAGIRLDGGNLVLRNTGFYDNENGILGGENGTSVTIEYSAFARNGFGDGFTHNLYIGFVDRLNVKASYFHHAKIGHNLKSRGKENYIENSYFLDGTTGYIYAPNNAQALTLTANLFAGSAGTVTGGVAQNKIVQGPDSRFTSLQTSPTRQPRTSGRRHRSFRSSAFLQCPTRNTSMTRRSRWC